MIRKTVERTMADKRPIKRQAVTTNTVTPSKCGVIWEASELLQYDLMGLLRISARIFRGIYADSMVETFGLYQPVDWRLVWDCGIIGQEEVLHHVRGVRQVSRDTIELDLAAFQFRGSEKIAGRVRPVQRVVPAPCPRLRATEAELRALFSGRRSFRRAAFA